jgi:hypothetical protein
MMHLSRTLLVCIYVLPTVRTAPTGDQGHGGVLQARAKVKLNQYANAEDW